MQTGRRNNHQAFIGNEMVRNIRIGIELIFFLTKNRNALMRYMLLKEPDLNWQQIYKKSGRQLIFNVVFPKELT